MNTTEENLSLVNQIEQISGGLSEEKDLSGFVRQSVEIITACAVKLKENLSNENESENRTKDAL